MPHRDDIVLTGLGMRTAVGNDAVQSCATIRTRIARFSAWKHGVIGASDDGVVVAALDPDLGDASWVDKDDAMSAQPLHEALWQAGIHDGRELRSQGGSAIRIGAWVATPSEQRPGVDAASERGHALRVGIAPAVADQCELVRADHAAALVAVDRAMVAVRERLVTVAVVRAVDSQLHMPWLEHLAAEQRLAHDDHPAGFIPGEAAVCLVLERFEHAKARSATPLAVVRKVAIEHEPIPIGPEHPIRAEALSRAVQRCVGEDAGSIRRVVADLDGERWRALEWSLVETRCLSALRKGWQLWHPADSIGDVGAAAGAVGIGVAARAFARGYADGGSVLVTCASIGGTRAAARIDPVGS